MYTILHEDYEVPHAALVIGIAVAILVLAFVLVEVGTWVSFLIFWMVLGSPQPATPTQAPASAPKKAKQTTPPQPKVQAAEQKQDKQPQEKAQKRKFLLTSTNNLPFIQRQVQAKERSVIPLTFLYKRK
jgi:hypothetical protein